MNSPRYDSRHVQRPSFEEGLSGPNAFNSRYFPDVFTKPHHHGHQVLERDIMSGVRKGNYMLPREHGKTRWMIGYALYRICLWLWLRTQGDTPVDEHIAIASVTAEVSTARVRGVREQLERNPAIAADFGPLDHAVPWTNEALMLDADRQKVDPTVRAFGTGAQVPGGRQTCLLRDDCTDPLLAQGINAEQYLDGQMTLYDSVQEPLLVEDGVVLNLQTPYNSRDIPFRLAERGIVLGPNDPLPLGFDQRQWVSRTWPAILTEETGEVLWPEVWSMERLAPKRRDNPLIFDQQMMCRPIDVRNVSMPTQTYWRPEWLEWRSGQWFMRGRVLRVYSGVDPASKGKEILKGSRMAIVTIGIDAGGIGPDGNRHPRRAYVLGAKVGRWGFTPGVLEIASEWRRWKSSAVFIEEVVFSNAYRDVLRRESPVPALPIAAEGDKVQRIQATLHPLAFHDGDRPAQLLTPEPTGKYATPELDAEWKVFPGGPLMDTMDGLEIAVRGAAEHALPTVPIVGARIGSMTAVQAFYGRG